MADAVTRDTMVMATRDIIPTDIIARIILRSGTVITAAGPTTGIAVTGFITRAGVGNSGEQDPKKMS
jgi:hypothetical protein